MQARSFLPLSLLLFVAAAACGPSEIARNPPSAAAGTAALHVDGHDVLAYTDTPYACGTADGDPHTPGHVRCVFQHRTVTASDGIDFNLDFPSGFTTQPAGTVIRLRHDVQLSELGYCLDGNCMGANDAAWDGAATVTLGPPATPRTATLDGAFSTDTWGSQVAMTFSALPITLAE